jgi:hypothetical protein
VNRRQREEAVKEVTNPRAVSPYRQARRKIEEHVRDAIVAALEAEGRSVTDIRGPDTIERQRRAADWDFLLDGERVGLEVTEFTLSTQEVQAGAGSNRVAYLIAARLSPLAVELGLGLLTVDLSYFVGAVPTKRRTASEAEPLLLAIEEGMRRMAAGGFERLDIRTPVPWVEPTVELHVVDRSSENPRVVVIHGSSGGGRQVVPVVEAFMAERAVQKGPQTAEYGQGILGIHPGWIADADNLVEAIESLADVPWWRVYYIDRTGAAILVYDRG